MLINKTSPKPFYEQVVLGIKEDILQGILQPGDKLLSVREMANFLMVNPNTVSKAYKTLEVDGAIVTVRGKGTFVNELEKEFRNEKEIEKVKKQFQSLVIEASYLNISKEELAGWLNETHEGLGGADNES